MSLHRRLRGLWPSPRRLLASAAVLAVSGGAVSYYWPDAMFFGRAVRRSVRSAAAVAMISLDYKCNFKGPAEESPAQKRARRGNFHTRTAARLLRLFQKNGGIYIKVGQHLSALEYILPTEYCTEMAVLHSQAPRSSLAEVQTVIAEEFGQSVDEIFSAFDEVPIGAASLAQVHRGVLRGTGEQVAVKVQHLQLQAFVDVDMFVIALLVKTVRRVFPEFNFDWIADEMRINLPREMNFVGEAQNSERVRCNFGRHGKIPMHGALGGILRIPSVHWKYTSRRVLTMEFLPGAKVTDRAFLDSHHISPRSVSSLITRAFSEMIFLHGFVHCDPHPGNLLVRSRAAAGGGLLGRAAAWVWPQLRPWELVLLDHGLYRELPDDFRRSYASLWRAVIEGDEPSIRRFAEEIGGGDAYRLFSCILTQRAWRTIATASIFSPLNPAEAAEIVAKAPEYLSKVADLLARVPRPLLLLFKTNDLLRHLERALLTDPTEPTRTFTIMAHYCIDALDEQPRQSVRAHLRACWAHLRISLLDLLLLVQARLARVRDFYTPRGYSYGLL